MNTSSARKVDDATAHNRASVIAKLQAAIKSTLLPLIPDGRLSMIDFPNYSNVGDSAIWLGQIAFLTRELRKRPSYTCSTATFSAAELRAKVPEGPILINGGGNFGTLWAHHHKLRLDAMRAFPGRPIIQLPQSIHFDSAESIAETAEAIRRHGAFTLLVRDHKSLEFARQHFDCAVHLCPDMAFYIGPVERLAPSVDFLCLMRTDTERMPDLDAPDDRGSKIVVDWLDESSKELRRTRFFARFAAIVRGDGISGHSPTVHDALAWQRFRRGVATLSQGRVVITDRLHAHIMSLLLDIPHVALDNSYGKLGNFIAAWTSGYDGLAQATNMKDAMAAGQRLLAGTAPRR